MDKRDRAEIFKQRLNDAVTRAGWSQTQLATAAGLDRSTVSQLLSGEEPRLASGQALAEFTVDLIARARAKGLDPLIGREAELRRTQGARVTAGSGTQDHDVELVGLRHVCLLPVADRKSVV